MSTTSILLIGATGRLGLQLIQKSHDSHPSLPIHAFARTPTNIPPPHQKLCTSLIQGDARNPADIKRALVESSANTVIMAVGVPNSLARTDVREDTARALAKVVGAGSGFEHVKVVVVSSTGAGGTKIEMGWGMGMALAFMLRHIMRDHDRQEEILKGLGGERVLVVRPTTLTDGKGGGKVVEFEGKMPSADVDREDVAGWIVDRVGGGWKGGEFNITKRK